MNVLVVAAHPDDEVLGCGGTMARHAASGDDVSALILAEGIMAREAKGDGAWINGGFFVLEPEIFNYINDDSVMWEHEPLEGLAKSNQLNAYKHNGFWKCMDNIRDKNELEGLWTGAIAPWNIWK
jgi:NDP-sugar pyrophosphorylase family protein